MSKLIVEVCDIKEIKTHTNADTLELAIVKGFQLVVRKGTFKAGDKIVYFPPDTMMKGVLSDQIGVTNYLSWQSLKDDKGVAVKNAEGKVVYDYAAGGRTRVVKLRGEPSFGIAIPCPDATWEVCKDVADHYGVWKYVPPFREQAADAAREHPLFHKYSEIENLRHFPDAFNEGEEVIATEKIHGSNCRVGLINVHFEFTPNTFIHSDMLVAGSMEIRRKIPVKPGNIKTGDGYEDCIRHDYDFDKAESICTDEDVLKSNRYWYPISQESVRNLLQGVKDVYGANSVLLFGEVFGFNIQKPFFYGSPTQMQFRAFDISVDGKYLKYDEFKAICDKYGVATAPVLYRGAYSFETLSKYVNGQTTLTDQKQIREGLVVRPVEERIHPKLGRLVAKFVGDDYLEMKDSGKVSDYTES